MSEPAPTETPLLATCGLRRLDAAKLRFTRRGATLAFAVDGDTLTCDKVTVVRSFPLSHPDCFWSVRNEKNEELGVIADPLLLAPDQLALLQTEMQRRYMLPVIRLILAVRERFDTLDFFVETDRGTCRFTTRQLRDNLLRPTPGRYIVTDVEGNRFDIPDIAQLPLASQAMLLRHI